MMGERFLDCTYGWVEAMTVRVTYYCPRCGCQSFRPSATRLRKDGLLRFFGVQAYRCYICRVRFYLFQPAILRSLVTEPAGATTALKAPQLSPLDTEIY